MASPADEQPGADADLGYMARHVNGDQVTIHVAGIHAIGSLGVIEYIGKKLGDLYNEIGDHSASLVIRTEYKGLTITGTELIVGPLKW